MFSWLGFQGDQNSVVGFDWSWLLKSVELFGEVAASKNGGRAILAGTILDLSPVQIAILYRNYQRDFQNFHAFAFGESNGTTQNEKGYYTGIKYKIDRTTTLSAFYDIFSKPWRTFFEPLPVEGRELLTQLNKKFNRNVQVTLRFREKTTQRTETFRDSFNRENREFVERRQKQFRFQLDLRTSQKIRLRTRVEFNKVRLDGYNTLIKDTKENGFLIYQDFRIEPNKKLQISARLTFFDTDSFDSRVFQYENDLPGLLTNRALFGKGNRWYLFLKYKLIQNVAFFLKYSESFRDDVDVIGSGPDQIDGNLDRRFGFQLEFRL